MKDVLLIRYLLLPLRCGTREGGNAPAPCTGLGGAISAFLFTKSAHNRAVVITHFVIPLFYSTKNKKRKDFSLSSL